MIALLLNHLWQSSLFLGVAGVIVLALRRNSAHIRFCVWYAASLKFLMPFAALTALSAYTLAPLVPPVSILAVKAAEPIAKPFSAPTTVQFTAGLVEPSAPLAHPKAQSAGQPLPGAYPFRLNLEFALLAIWTMGFVGLVGRWFRRWLRVRALAQNAEPSNIAAPVDVKFSSFLLEPALVGILVPMILLPRDIEQELSPGELRAVLAHEICHWRRRDNLLAATHMVVETLFWFFPFVWWLGARLNAERERACDECVLAEGNDPQVYTDGILKICSAYLRSPLACVAGVSGAGLKSRIAAILENRLVSRLGVAGRAVLSTCAIVVLAFPVALGLLATPVAVAKAAPTPFQGKAPERDERPQPDDVSGSANGAPAETTTGQPTDQTLQINQAVSSTSAAPSHLLSQMLPKTLRMPSLDWSHLLSPVNPTLLASNETSPGAADIDPAHVKAVSPNIEANQTAAGESQFAQNQAEGRNSIASASPNPETRLLTQSCARPALVNSMTLEPTPGSDLMTVTATIDGNPEKLLLDIGRRRTELWDATAARLKLAVSGGIGDWDLAGRYSFGAARIGKFTIGSIFAGGIFLKVGNDPESTPVASDGVLRDDTMWDYDIDLDFAHHRMNYFTPEQCKGGGIYWSPTTITAVPILAYTGTQYADRSPIPRFGTTYVPVTLEGHVILALLDTSLDRTLLNPDVAKRLFGLDAASLDEVTANDGGAPIKAGGHRFSTLSLGGLTASNLLVAIPFDKKTESSGITHVSKTAQSVFLLHEIMPDLVVGMDVLKHTHLYVSYQNDRVYVSAAGDGQSLNPGPIEESRLKRF